VTATDTGHMEPTSTTTSDGLEELIGKG
jgi:hypothetical protein